MKTRLIIASSLTFAIAFVLAIAMRTSAVAQQDPPPQEEPPAEDFTEEEASDQEQPPPGRTPDSEADELSLDGASEDEEADLAETDEESAAVEGEEDEADLEAEEEGMTFDFTSTELEDGTAVREDSSERITVDFPDEEIRAILRVVADLFDLNLVIPEELDGRASIKLRDVTWRQVFDVVLSPAGFTYVEDGNIIKVVSLESLTLEPPMTTVVILDYAQAAGIVETVRPLVGTEAGGRIQVDARSNALVITERPTQLRRIEAIIADLDKPNVQVMIESKFIETRNRNLKNIGVNWASLDGYGVRAGPFNRTYEREKGRNTEHTRSEHNIDVPHQQDGFDRAGQLAGVPVGPPFTVDEDGNRTYPDLGPASLDSATNLYNRTRLDTAVFSADQFDVILSALRTTNDVKLVSNPTVVTLNNRPASIHVGEEFPIVLPRFNPQTGTYEAGEYSTIEIGIKLNVTPQVNNAGFINMEVEPDVSTLADTVSYFGAQYPVRSTRNAKSFVTIRDGYTLAIGGLLQDDTVESESRVPLLGSIPVLGRLFRSNSTDKDQRNLIIFLTARSLSPEGGTVEDTVDPRKIHAMGLRRDEIPGYQPDIPMWPEEEKAAREAAEREAAELEAAEREAAELEAAEREAAEANLEAEDETDAAEGEDALEAETDADGEADEAVEADGETEAESEAADLDTVNEEPIVTQEPAAEEEEEEAPTPARRSDEVTEEPAPAEEEPAPAPRRRSGYLTP